MRYKITIEYDGTPFVGWQKQKDGLSVQSVLEKALEEFSGELVEVFSAGRTDAGVHATAQVAHFDLLKDWEEKTVQDALNAKIDRKYPISILNATKVPEDFHARFSAQERMYLYKIVNRRSPLALDQNRAWWVPMPLNMDNMVECSKILLGNHDFSSFRASECQAKSPVKTLDEILISSTADEISFYVRAKSFLHHQIRNIVGTLKLAGEGKIGVDGMKRILEARDRTQAGPTAPAAGLYFIGVRY